MEIISIYDESWLGRITDWLTASGELLIERYYPHSGGSGTYFFIVSLADLAEMTEQARPGAVFYVFRRKQFPIRGIVDDAFFDRALEAIPDGAWYLFTPPSFYPTPVSYESGNTHLELRAELEARRGALVGLGRDPSTFEAQAIEDGELIVVQKP